MGHGLLPLGLAGEAWNSGFLGWGPELRTKGGPSLYIYIYIFFFFENFNLLNFFFGPGVGGGGEGPGPPLAPT